MWYRNFAVSKVQHIVESTSIVNLDKVNSEFDSKGFTVVSSFDTPMAKIVFFKNDTFEIKNMIGKSVIWNC